MKVFRGLPSLADRRPCALTIGNFDGVHLGHRTLLARVSDAAQRLGVETAVMTFEPHPREFFARMAGDDSRAPSRIANLRDKLQALAQVGVDRVIVEHFNAHFASLSPESFIRQILVEGLQVKWLIVGDGVMRQELEAYVTALGLQQEVKFLGRIHNHDLPSYLASSTFYVSMPMTEGVSASLFEAMAAGCYPLVTDLPGNRYWVRNGDNGQLIPVNDSAALAQKIITLYHQPEVLSKAVNDNRAFIESYANFEVNMKKIADKYHQLIDQYSGK